MSSHTDGSGSGAPVSSGAEVLGDGDAGADVVGCEAPGAGVPSPVVLGETGETGEAGEDGEAEELEAGLVESLGAGEVTLVDSPWDGELSEEADGDGDVLPVAEAAGAASRATGEITAVAAAAARARRSFMPV
ncbi:hypothetical protein [Streptomyces violaceorubidus]|uniref:hypothetical protein n=1 Tax=Streptomyces violaceorubidus TaxID=284042 RepID=UPI001FD817B7|nr:hypothetical protein [Streptomyces violaceorubidus]